MNIGNYTMPLELARRANALKTEEEYAEYDRQRKLRNKAPEAQCSVADCGHYDTFRECKGYCMKADQKVSDLKACPINAWKRRKV